jgi:flagellar biosynthetic protein FliR
VAGDGVSIDWVFSSVLLSLRVAPVFALAPPFTLTQVPPMFRALFGVGIAACLVASDPAAARLTDLGLATIVITAARELLLGGVIVMAFQVMFGALYVAGRALDIQAGFGLALLIDPTSNSQTPLIGTLLAYTAGAVFFAMDGHAELLRVIGASLHAIPLGTGALPVSLDRLTGFVSLSFLIAFGVAGGSILCLFLADVAIAVLSRTVPQMNVLILGLQVKTIVLLVVLPTSFGFAGVLLARLVRVTLEAIPGLL